MATKKEETKETKDTNEVKATPVSWEDQKVRVSLFKDNERYKEDVTVVVNGKAFRIQRGVEVEIPMYVWNVLKKGMAQDVRTANMIQREEDAYRSKEKEFNW